MKDKYINEDTTREEINGFIAAAELAGYGEDYGLPRALTPNGNLFRVARSDEEAQNGWKNYLRATLTEFTPESLSEATGIAADRLQPSLMKEGELAELIEKHYGLDKFIEEEAADKEQRCKLSEESSGEVKTKDGCFAWKVSYSGIPFNWECFTLTEEFKRRVEGSAKRFFNAGFNLKEIVNAITSNLGKLHPTEYGDLKLYLQLVEKKVEEISRAVVEKDIS